MNFIRQNPHKNTIILASSITLIVIFFALLVFPDSSSADETWQALLDSGELRIGMEASYPPFETIAPDGSFTGFDVDLSQEIAHRLGVEPVFYNIAYDSLYDSLYSGRVDILISGLVPAYAVEGKANFSVPYFNAGEHLVVGRGTPVDNMQDLENRILAVEYGAGGDIEARKWQRRFVSLTILRNVSAGEALAAVGDGRADAALVDGVSARLGTVDYPELYIAESVTDVFFAAAVHPENEILLKRVNEAIESMAGDGTLDILINRWFGPR